MFCPHCGSQIPGNTTFCPSCGAKLGASAPAAPAAPVQPKPAQASTGAYKDYKAFSIIIAVVSFLCCGGWVGVIFGVLGIVFSSQAKTFYDAGDMVQAEAKSKSARTMCILGIVMIVIGAIMTCILLTVYGASIVAMIATEMGMLAL